jgi:hypothetical protein
MRLFTFSLQILQPVSDEVEVVNLSPYCSTTHVVGLNHRQLGHSAWSPCHSHWEQELEESVWESSLSWC